jgi:hypothetical protein
MARQKEYKKIDIDVEPFLSIMAIVLKLISLVLVVIVMRIAVNPKGKKIISLTGLYEGHGNQENPKSPSYIDCSTNGITLYPGAMVVTWEQLQRPENPVDQLLDKIQADASNEYVVVMVRPKSVKYYRAVRSMISKRPIDVGYDAVDADFKVNWDAAQKALAISTD